MKPLHLEVEISSLSDDAVVVASERLGLVARDMGMKEPAGARHWHLSRPGSSGTLEVTWLPPNRLVIEARSNRFAEWQIAVSEDLMMALADHSRSEM